MPRVRGDVIVQRDARVERERAYPVTFQNFKLDMKDLTIRDELSKQERTELCFKLTKELGSKLYNVDLLYMQLGMILSIVKQNDLYKHHAEHVKTWVEYIKDINIGINAPAADHYIRMFEVFGIDVLVNGKRLPFSRCLDMAPIIKEVTAEQREEWLASAETLPPRAWRDKVREAKGKVTSDACDHAQTERWDKCKDCGRWIRFVTAPEAPLERRELNGKQRKSKK